MQSTPHCMLPLPIKYGLCAVNCYNSIHTPCTSMSSAYKVELANVVHDTQLFYIYDEVVTHNAFTGPIHYSHSFIVFYTRNHKIGGDNYQRWWYLFSYRNNDGSCANSSVMSS